MNTHFNTVTNCLSIQYRNGQVHKYGIILYLLTNQLVIIKIKLTKDQNWIIMDQFQFPQPCPMFKTVKTAEHKEAYIGLTQYYRLYANKIELSNNCSSFYIHDEYLLFTDHTNTLKFVDLKKISI